MSRIQAVRSARAATAAAADKACSRDHDRSAGRQGTREGATASWTKILYNLPMILTAARAACPGAPRSARVARRPGYNPYARRDWLRISHRLATGMTAGEVARAEAVEVAEIEGLLAQPDFSGLVDAARALAARPDAEQTARLVTLARFALEMALADGDMRVAFFILREADRGRDPAATVAEGVLAASRRKAPGGDAATFRPPRSASPRPRGRAEDPDARWLRQGALAVQGAVVAEHAIRHAAADAPATGGATTEAAARRALALRAVADRSPSSARPIAALARELAGGTAPVSLGVGQAPAASLRPPIAGLPRRPRAP